MPAVTVSAGYGTGGSVIARELAQRLDYRLLDRAISSQVAQRLQVSVSEAEEGSRKRSLGERFLGSLAPMSGGMFGPDDDSSISAALIAGNDQVFREHAEHIMRDAVAEGAVILGRAGAAALHGEPDVLTVRLFGHKDARVRHAARAEDVDHDTAAARLPQVDRARAQYVRHLYGCDIDDPRLFDVQLDSTLIPTSTCVEIIAMAFTAFLARKSGTSTP